LRLPIAIAALVEIKYIYLLALGLYI